MDYGIIEIKILEAHKNRTEILKVGHARINLQRWIGKGKERRLSGLSLVWCANQGRSDISTGAVKNRKVADKQKLPKHTAQHAKSSQSHYRNTTPTLQKTNKNWQIHLKITRRSQEKQEAKSCQVSFVHFPVNWKKALKVFHVACVVLWCVLCGDHAEWVVGGMLKV